MKKVALLSAACGLASALAFGGTPTIDGTFDGVSVWGDPVSTSSTTGFAGVTATALYVTSDTQYVYFCAQVSGLDGWMGWGFAIDSRTGGSNGLEPWQRQVTFSFPQDSNYDAPDFVIRGRADDNWAELRTWNSSTTSWDGAGTDYRPNAAANFSNGVVEARVAKSTLQMRLSKQGQVVFYVTGHLDFGQESNKYGLFSSLPYNTPCSNWDCTGNPTPVSNTLVPVWLPVSLSAFTIE